MPRGRIFFPRRRLKRRVIMGAGIIATAIVIFAIGFYTGSNYPDLFDMPRAMASTLY